MSPAIPFFDNIILAIILWLILWLITVKKQLKCLPFPYWKKSEVSEEISERNKENKKKIKN